LEGKSTIGKRQKQNADADILHFQRLTRHQKRMPDKKKKHCERKRVDEKPTRKGGGTKRNQPVSSHQEPYRTGEEEVS